MESQTKHNNGQCPSCRSKSVNITPIIPRYLVQTDFIGASIDCSNSNCSYRGSASSIQIHTVLCPWDKQLPANNYNNEVYQCPELIVKIISCTACRQLPLVNTCIYQCRYGHLYCSTCINLGSRYSTCFVLGCDSPTKFTSLSTMQFLHLLIQIPDLCCHYNGCRYTSEFHSTLLHIRNCPNVAKGVMHSGCIETVDEMPQ